MDGGSTTVLGSQFQCHRALSKYEFLLKYNLNFPWCNLRTFPLILSLDAQETGLIPTLASSKVIVEYVEASFLQAKQPELPQQLVSLVLQTPHQLYCPSLDTSQHLNVLVMRGPRIYITNSLENIVQYQEIKLFYSLACYC